MERDFYFFPSFLLIILENFSKMAWR